MTRRINQNRTHYNVSADRARQTKEAHAAKKPGVVVYDRDAGAGQIPRNLKPPAERNHAEDAEQCLILRARPLPGWL